MQRRRKVWEGRKKCSQLSKNEFRGVGSFIFVSMQFFRGRTLTIASLEAAWGRTFGSPRKMLQNLFLHFKVSLLLRKKIISGNFETKNKVPESCSKRRKKCFEQLSGNLFLAKIQNSPFGPPLTTKTFFLISPQSCSKCRKKCFEQLSGKNIFRPSKNSKFPLGEN